MPSSVPTPLAAALGLVPATLSGVRRLPGKVVQIPILAVSSALTTLDRTRRGYDDLAERGERLVAKLRGVSFDEVEDRVEDALQGTPAAAAYDRVEDAAEDVVSGAASALRSVTGAAQKATQNAGDALQETADQAQEVADVAPAAEAPKGRPTPKASGPDDTRVDSAASPAAQRAADNITASTGEVLAHDDLPLADYDHMTLGSLRGRLRSLSLEQLGQVRAYEKAHADRLPVVTMLDNRIAKLTSDITVQPTGKTDAPVPELQPSQVARGGSKVQPGTGGPKQNPTSQGDPTNPGQPRGSGSGSTNPHAI
ncbi:MAG: uncharacterized protein JWO60_447 [Frankiales bacterium]|nr:uncharacterized protein [Frankiales bacterium]